MDEYRGRFANYDRREPSKEHHPPPEPPPPAEPYIEPVLPASGLLHSFGIGSDFLGSYMPILLLVVGAVVLYLMVGKLDLFGGLLGGILG